MQEFQFVNSNDRDAQREARSYLAKATHRKVRQRQIKRFKAAETQTASPSSESGPSSDSDGDTAATEYSSTWADRYASGVTTSPQDSFQTTYSQLDAGDRNLLEWCIKVPELAFGIEHTAILNLMRDWVFSLVGNSTVVLHSSLLIGAVNHPTFSQGKEGASRILIQKGRTIGLINQGLREDWAAIKDDIMYAVAATAISDHRLCNYDACQMHLGGLKRMIRVRGGIRSLNPPLRAAVVWAEVSVSNHAAPLPRSLHSNETSQRAETSNLSLIEDPYEGHLFCWFLTGLQRVQSKRHSHVSVDRHTLGKAEFLFQKGSPLLAVLEETDQDTGAITPNSQMNAYNCQIACLFYINFMLCEVHDHPQLTAAFPVRLSWLVRQYRRNRVPRASLFVWIIFCEIEKDDGGKGDCLDWLIRMIRVARRLSQESIQMLRKALSWECVCQACDKVCGRKLRGMIELSVLLRKTTS